MNETRLIIILVVFGLLSTILAGSIFNLMYYAYDNFYVQPFLDSLPEIERLYANPAPFYSTKYGITEIAAKVFIALAWLMLLIYVLRLHVLSWKKNRSSSSVASFSNIRKKTITILWISLFLIAFTVSISPVKATDLYEVDVLGIRDEEARAHPEWTTNLASLLQEVNERRFIPHGIVFNFRGWLRFDWDSDDATIYAYDLTQECILESGLPHAETRIAVPPDFMVGQGFPGCAWTDPTNGATYYIDLLFIFTGQDNCDIGALSVPEINMTIFKKNNCLNFHDMTHELGHQFYVHHCGENWCVMTLGLFQGDDFGSRCGAFLNAMRGKWTSDIQVFVGLNPLQGTLATDFQSFECECEWVSGNCYLCATRKSGTIFSVSIQVQGLPGWIFDHYLVTKQNMFGYENGSPADSYNIYEQSFTLVTNRTVTVIPVFRKGSVLSVWNIRAGNTDPGSGAHTYEINTNVIANALPENETILFKNWFYGISQVQEENSAPAVIGGASFFSGFNIVFAQTFVHERTFVASWLRLKLNKTCPIGYREMFWVCLTWAFDGVPYDFGSYLVGNVFYAIGVSLSSQGNWYDIKLPEIMLQANTQYAIQLCQYELKFAPLSWCYSSDTYSEGKAFVSPDGGRNYFELNADFLFQIEGYETMVSNENQITITMSDNASLYGCFMSLDLNEDGLIDIFDIVQVAVAFGSEPHGPYWDNRADINYDGYINIFDIVLIALNYPN